MIQRLPGVRFGEILGAKWQGSTSGHGLVTEMILITVNQSASVSVFGDIYNDKCDRSWNMFNYQDNLESWRRDSLGRATRDA